MVLFETLEYFANMLLPETPDYFVNMLLPESPEYFSNMQECLQWNEEGEEGPGGW